MRITHQISKNPFLGCHAASCHAAGRQTGLSLIELMIAMLIGLFLMLSVSSVYLSNLKTSKARDQFSVLEDNARLALDTLTGVIEHSGYNTVDGVAIPNKFIVSAVNKDECVADETLFTPATYTKHLASGDSVGVIYIGDDDVTTDCSGDALQAKCRLKNAANPGKPASSSQIYNSFYLDASDPNNKKLQCVGSINKKVQLIAEGIDNMQIRYGIDTDNSGIANRYEDASNISTLGNNVVSVQIAILARSLKPVKNKAEAKTFDLLGEKVSYNDRYQRALFSTTVQLRNSL